MSAGSKVGINRLGGVLKTQAFHRTFVLMAASAGLLAQWAPAQSGATSSPAAASGQVAGVAPMRSRKGEYAPPAPFSRLALSGGISAMGINLQAAVNAGPHLNVRTIGNYFNYSVNNVKIDGGDGSNGVSVSGKLNFASLGTALDYYPFPRHGWRLSPGVMLLNQNSIAASGASAAGTSITLGSQQYYSDAADPFAINASLGLNTRQRAFTMTTGWGNMISRRGGHWSLPFEVGAVFTGVPTIKINLTGSACTNQADAAGNGPSCVNMAANANAQSNLNAQIAKYQSDLNPLQAYPLISFGVAYNFALRRY
jgi:hypothetical protein